MSTQSSGYFVVIARITTAGLRALPVSPSCVAVQAPLACTPAPKKKHGLAPRARHRHEGLKRPPSTRGLVHHQVNVQGQRKFLAAQDTQKELSNRMRLGTLRGNPYIK